MEDCFQIYKKLKGEKCVKTVKNIYILRLTMDNMRFVPGMPLSEKKPDYASLDKKDERIIMMLSVDGRVSTNRIAKAVNLSRDAVKYRIRRLEEKDIIFKPMTVLDISKFGYDSYHVFIKLNNPRIETEARIIRSLIGLPYVRAVLKLNGTYDLEVALISRNVSEFDGFMNDMMALVGNHVQESEVLIITKYFRSSDLPHVVDDVEHMKTKAADGHGLDDGDMRILKVIRDNARLPLMDISRSVKMSADSVKYRMRRMEGSVISGYQTPVNHEALGYNVHAVMMNIVGFDQEKERQLGTFFDRSPNIIFAVKTIGKYNLLIYTCTRRERDLYSTIAGLRGLMPEKIRSYESMQIFSKHKYIYAPDCLFEKK